MILEELCTRPGTSADGCRLITGLNMLNTFNIVLLILSLAGMVAFGFLLVSSFKRSVLWGLGVLLVPFVTLFYGIKYWQEVKKPFLAYVGINTVSFALLAYLFTQLGGMQAIEMAQKIEDGTMTEQDAAQFMVGTMQGMEDLGAGSKEEMLAQMRADPNLTEEDIKQFEMMFGQIEAVASGEQQSFVEGDWQEQADGGPLQLAMASDAPQVAPPAADMDEIEAKIAEMEAKMAMMNGTVEQVAPVEEEPANISSLGYPMPDYVESPIKQSAQPSKQPAKKTSGANISLAEAKHYIGDSVSVTNKQGVTRHATLLDVHAARLEFQRRSYGGSVTFSVPRHQIKGLMLE